MCNAQRGVCAHSEPTEDTILGVLSAVDGSSTFPLKRKKNTVVKWLPLVLHIWVVPSLTLSMDTCYPDQDFSRVSSGLPGKCQNSTSN
jgi:hypothetical protein